MSDNKNTQGFPLHVVKDDSTMSDSSDSSNSSYSSNLSNLQQLAEKIRAIGLEIGFSDVRITDPNDLRSATLFTRWQALNNAGDMAWLPRHANKRTAIKQIHPSTRRVICVRLDYLSGTVSEHIQALDTAKPFISVYARNKDYHKLMRKMLKQFAQHIEAVVEQSIDYRVFVDSAPVLEKPLAEKAGLGWIGKHTNLLHHEQGSFFFLGELAINLPLPTQHRIKPRCGSCRACIDVCPTKAIVAPYQLDVEKCISYLTIEHEGVIADALKAQIGNRIYGCDDCQLFCPWNRYAKQTTIDGFIDQSGRWEADYLTLFAWDEQTFLEQTAGTPIRRIGHNRWQRNLAIGMGNAIRNQQIDEKTQSHWRLALQENKNPHPAVIDAVQWAIRQTTEPTNNPASNDQVTIKQPLSNH